MTRTNKPQAHCRIVIEQPVVGVPYSLQAKDGSPLDPKRSADGEPLAFDFPISVAPGPKLSGDQIRREGPARRFVYVRVGQLAGDPSSPWSRRIKIDVHDIDQAMLDRAIETGAIIETTIAGTAPDGTPSCATVKPLRRRISG